MAERNEFSEIVAGQDAQSNTRRLTYTIDDYAATIYEKLGLDRKQPIYTPANRPIMLARKSGRFRSCFRS